MAFLSKAVRSLSGPHRLEGAEEPSSVAREVIFQEADLLQGSVEVFLPTEISDVENTRQFMVS